MKRINSKQSSSNGMSRRTLLRGVSLGAVTALSLPPLEVMFGSDSAYAQATSNRARFVGVYTPNGTIQERWCPKPAATTVTRTFSLAGTALAPLERHKANLSVFRNAQNAGSNGNGNAHMKAIAGFLTGRAIPNDTVGTHQVSIDQFVTNAAAQKAGIGSLQLAGNNELDPPNNTRYNNSLKNALSFDAQGRILPNTANLRAVFDRVFKGVSPVAGPGADAAAQRRALMRNSVLDAVAADRAALSTKLGQQDRVRVDEYFESLRALELDIDALAPQCTIPSSNDFPQTQDGPRLNAIGNHGKLAGRLIALAFVCDLVQSATYMMGGEGTGCGYSELNINQHFHNTISHNRAAKADLHHRIDTFHSDLVASLLDALEDTSYATGTLLDGTAVLYGAGLGNADSHSLSNIGLVLAGRFGKVRQGAFHTDLKNQNHAKILRTIVAELGLDADAFLPGSVGTLDLT